MTARESIFMCTFCTPQGEESTCVLAWSAEQALQVLRDQLVRNGVNDAEDFHVGPALGRRGMDEHVH